MRTRVWFQCMLALSLMGYSHVHAASDRTPTSGKLSYGWATTSITPDKPVALDGQYETRITGRVHDPLTATALAIETRGQNCVIDQAVMVSCDLMAIRRKTLEKVRELVSKRVPDLDVKKILISTTHTHTAPALTDAEETDLHPYDYMGSWAYRIPPEREDVMRQAEYLDFLAEWISDVVVKAWKARKPGGLISH